MGNATKDNAEEGTPKSLKRNVEVAEVTQVIKFAEE